MSSSAPVRSKPAVLLALMSVCSALNAAPAGAADEPGRYEGTIAIDYTPSSYNPNFPNNPDQGPSKALVKADCSDVACTIVSEPLESIGAFWGEGVSYPLTVPIGGSVDVPRVSAEDDVGSECPIFDASGGTITLSLSGDEMTLVAEFPEYEVVAGNCVAWDQTIETTFTGRLSEPVDDDEVDSDAVSETTIAASGTGAAPEPKPPAASADPGSGGGSTAAPIAGGAVLALAVGAGVVARKRRRHRSPDAAPLVAAAQPDVRPVPDRGRQAVALRGPTVSTRVRPVFDAHPRTAITFGS